MASPKMRQRIAAKGLLETKEAARRLNGLGSVRSLWRWGADSSLPLHEEELVRAGLERSSAPRALIPFKQMGSSIDVGDQDATAIFYTTDEHKTAAELSKQQLGSSGKFKKPIATAVLPAGKVSSSSSYDCRGIVSYLDGFPTAGLPG